MKQHKFNAQILFLGEGVMTPRPSLDPRMLGISVFHNFKQKRFKVNMGV